MKGMGWPSSQGKSTTIVTTPKTTRPKDTPNSVPATGKKTYD